MRQSIFENDSFEVILANTAIGGVLDVYSVRDPYTGVWYMVTRNGICVRVDQEGKPYTERWEDRGI